MPSGSPPVCWERFVPLNNLHNYHILLTNFDLTNIKILTVLVISLSCTWTFYLTVTSVLYGRTLGSLKRYEMSAFIFVY